MKGFFGRLVAIFLIWIIGFLCGAVAYHYTGYKDYHIAPTYALDSQCSWCIGNNQLISWRCNKDKYLSDFSCFWQEATKNTTFTIDGKPVQITDVQVFYKQTASSVKWYHYTTTEQNYTYGNITYYPSGIENSQTYVVSTPILMPDDCGWLNNCLDWKKWEGAGTILKWASPTPTPTPIPDIPFGCFWYSSQGYNPYGENATIRCWGEPIGNFSMPTPLWKD